MDIHLLQFFLIQYFQVKKFHSLTPSIIIITTIIVLQCNLTLVNNKEMLVCHAFRSTVERFA